MSGHDELEIWRSSFYKMGRSRRVRWCRPWRSERAHSALLRMAWPELGIGCASKIFVVGEAVRERDHHPCMFDTVTYVEEFRSGRFAPRRARSAALRGVISRFHIKDESSSGRGNMIQALDKSFRLVVASRPSGKPQRISRPVASPCRIARSEHETLASTLPFSCKMGSWPRHDIA